LRNAVRDAALWFERELEGSVTDPFRGAATHGVGTPLLAGN